MGESTHSTGQPAIAPASGDGLSRRGFLSGLFGAAGVLGLGPVSAVAAAGPATVLLSPRQRAFALAHDDRKFGTIQVLEAQSIAMVDAAGHRFVLQLGSLQPLRSVHAAWMASATELLLLDAQTSRLHRYTVDGIALGCSRIPAQPLLAAAGCADGAGGSYVSLPGDHQIARLSPSGEVLQRFGQRGAASGQLNYPTALARRSDGTLLVANTGNRRIDLYSADGRFRGTLARFKFMPRHLAISGGTAAVYDAQDNRVAMLSPHTGQLMDSVALSALHPRRLQGRALTAAGAQRFLVSV